MKIRESFVSNSSSSSFVYCSNCGGQGYDESMDYYKCVNGHTICDACMEGGEDFEAFEEWLESPDNDRFYVPADLCCCCKGYFLTNEMIEKYIWKQYGFNAATIGKEIKNRFQTIDELVKWIKEPK